MANPKRRHSKSRRDKRRAHWKLEEVSSGLCPECKQPKLPHKVCLNCGFYNGETVLIVKKKKSKKEEESQGDK